MGVFLLFRYELRFLRVQDGSTAQKLLPHSCCQLGSKNCCLLALIARCLHYSLVTSCLWNSIIILCILQRKKKNRHREREREMHLLLLCFSTRIYFTSAPSLSSLSTGLLCVFIVTSKWPSPPRSLQKAPHPSFLVWRPKKKKERHIKRGGYYTYFPGCKTIPDMWDDFFFKITTGIQLHKNATADVVANLFGRVLWWLLLKIGDSRVHVNWHV